MMTPALKTCVLAAGVFLMTGLLTGTWKYLCIRSSPEHRAPVYVDIAHRASLMYSFASLVLGKLAEYSPYSTGVTLVAAVLPLAYFALAIATYVVHGVLRDTDNQLAPPHRLGSRTVPAGLTSLFMWSLIAGEIGGTAVLLWGFVTTVFLGG